MGNKTSTAVAGPLALAATTTDLKNKGKSKPKESASENVEEEFALLLKKVRRMLKKNDFRASTFQKRGYHKRKDKRYSTGKSSQFQKDEQMIVNYASIAGNLVTLL